jgi:hypothetical protein
MNAGEGVVLTGPAGDAAMRLDEMSRCGNNAFKVT